LEARAHTAVALAVAVGLAPAREAHAALLRSEARVRRREGLAQRRERDDARLGRGLATRADEAVGEHPAPVALDVEPVGDARVAVREHDAHAPVGVDVRLVLREARLPARAVARPEPGRRAQREAPVVGAGGLPAAD